MVDYRAAARECARVLVSPGLASHTYRKASVELLARLKDLVPLEPYAKGHPLWTNVHIRSGLVVAPGYAQDSVGSGAYLATFGRELDRLIAAHTHREPDRPLEVLYPACGPFFGAGLIVALLWPATAVRLTLVEVSSAALDMARALAGALGLADHIAEYVHADASRWTPAQTYDVLLVSAVGTALAREPQIAIAANLVPFLKPDGVLMPRSLDLRLGVFNVEETFEPRKAPGERPDRVPRPVDGSVRNLLHVDLDWLLQRGRPDQWQSWSIDLGEIVQASAWAPGTVPATYVDIEVAKDHLISPGASGATLPMPRLDMANARNLRWACQYVLERDPGIVLTEIPGDI